MSDSPRGKGPDDQRRHAREPLTLVVDYDGADDLVADYTDNLSSGGIFVNTSHPFEVGASVRLCLSFPGLIEPIAIEGVVRWARTAEDPEPGVGIEFTDYDEAARSRLEEIVAGIRRRDPDLVTRLVKVLVVEDNPHVAQLIKDGLSGSSHSRLGGELSFNFRTAVNGQEALDILHHESFDALIIDIYLPILDGPSVIRSVRADEHLRGVPIIAVSAGGDSARQSAMAAGADFFLEKPMRLRQVIETLRKLTVLD